MTVHHPTGNSKLLDRRARLLGPNVSTFYDEPVHIVKGEGVWLWDADGRRYLDCYNNVPHVGHCNPRVVEAISGQAATLNTHTRYLHEGILEYVERLTGTFDDPLSTAILTCTGSEANDIALRMAEAVTGRRGIIASDFTYHGNTSLVSQLSRSNVPGVGKGDWVRFVPAPDSYRPLGGTAGMAHAQAFAEAISEQIETLKKTEHGFAGLILCPFFVNEGFPSLPEGWLKPAIDLVRKEGGIFIADEVQPGFGRIGTHMWGHQRHAVVPDVVTLGKPMANGHPVGGVVTSPDVMSAFRNSFRYFNTFGGNPVSCAAAMAVLDELEDKDLLSNARAVGNYAQSRLQGLARKYDFIGDRRGSGLIFGAEMVLDPVTKEPAAEFTDRVVNEMRRRGIILSKLGRHKNTLKIRPPMPFATEHADLLFDTLDDVLASTPLHHG
ncbi:MAG: aminotransferase class III-fold pyridoxal phosphate-dependent enzyme [Pseudomonadota bacterium]